MPTIAGTVEQQWESLTFGNLYKDLNALRLHSNREIVKPDLDAQNHFVVLNIQLHNPLVHRYPSKAYDVGVRLDESEIRS